MVPLSNFAIIIFIFKKTQRVRECFTVTQKLLKAAEEPRADKAADDLLDASCPPVVFGADMLLHKFKT